MLCGLARYIYLKKKIKFVCYLHHFNLSVKLPFSREVCKAGNYRFVGKIAIPLYRGLDREEMSVKDVPCSTETFLQLPAKISNLFRRECNRDIASHLSLPAKHWHQHLNSPTTALLLALKKKMPSPCFHNKLRNALALVSVFLIKTTPKQGFLYWVGCLEKCIQDDAIWGSGMQHLRWSSGVYC